MCYAREKKTATIRTRGCYPEVTHTMKAFYETRSENLFVGEMTHYPYPLHVHEIVELIGIREGSCTMQIDGKPYELNAGDIAIMFPLVPHSYDSLSEDIHGFASFFLSDTIEEFAGTFHTMLPVEPVLRAGSVPAEARLAIDQLMSTPNEQYSPSRLAYLHLLLASVLHAMQFQPTGAFNERGLAYRVVKYIFDHAFESITLTSAAHGLGVSESHLSHLFSQQFHINFRRFVNAIRIDKAKMLMRDPHMTLTAICYSCGYENMRTFRRAFVRETGLLPTAYLQELRNENGLISAMQA